MFLLFSDFSKFCVIQISFILISVVSAGPGTVLDPALALRLPAVRRRHVERVNCARALRGQAAEKRHFGG